MKGFFILVLFLYVGYELAMYGAPELQVLGVLGLLGLGFKGA